MPELAAYWSWRTFAAALVTLRPRKYRHTLACALGCQAELLSGAGELERELSATDEAAKNYQDMRPADRHAREAVEVSSTSSSSRRPAHQDAAGRLAPVLAALEDIVRQRRLRSGQHAQPALVQRGSSAPRAGVVILELAGCGTA